MLHRTAAQPVMMGKQRTKLTTRQQLVCRVQSKVPTSIYSSFGERVLHTTKSPILPCRTNMCIGVSRRRSFFRRFHVFNTQTIRIICSKRFSRQAWARVPHHACGERPIEAKYATALFFGRGAGSRGRGGSGRGKDNLVRMNKRACGVGE